jgi:2-polyprenyl-3-methyl-5-hydroxy-6-metoxy-1,4-benzoquinol methylase
MTDYLKHYSRMPPEGNEWEARRLKAKMCVLPWIEQTVSLRGKTVLEYGCGAGPVSCALGLRAHRLIGIDIDRSAVDLGRQHAAAEGLANVELIYSPADEILDCTAAASQGVDVFLLYAVLEHMTISERLEILELARSVVRSDGVIVICELPNRLIPFDGHSSQMPFFDQLQNELAVRYYKFSQRDDFVSAMDVAVQGGADGALETLARWGRGMSFHEFELTFGDLRQHVIASNYDELLMPVRDISKEKLSLAKTMEEYRPDLAPVWSRYWQDLILSAEPVITVPPFIRPFPLDMAQGRGTRWLGGGRVEMPTEATLNITLPVESSRFLIGVNADVDELTVEVGTTGGVVSACMPVWRSRAHTRYATLDALTSGRDVEVRLGSPGYLTFFGYAA